MTLEEPPQASPPARTLAWIWLIVGGVGVLVGVLTTVFMIVVFGLVAAALGGALLVVANLRDTSRKRTARTLSGDPPPPGTAPYRPPPRPEPGPDDEDTDDEDRGPGGREHADDHEPDGSGTAQRGTSDARRAGSTAEDGTGVPEDDRPA